MAALRVLARVCSSVVRGVEPLSTLVALTCLCALGANAVSNPVVKLARSVLDLLDGAADAVMTFTLRSVGSLFGVADERTEQWVESAVGLVDVQEKLAAVHLLGMALELLVLLALAPLWWHGQPWSPPGGAWRAWPGRAAAWWSGLSTWVKAERLTAGAVGVAGALSASSHLQAATVRTAHHLGGAAVMDLLASVGWVAFALALVVCLLHGVVPLMTVQAAVTTGAGRTRRLACLFTALLSVSALLDWAW